MEAMSPSSPSISDHQGPPAYDDFSVQQSFLFSDSLMDLKNLRSQLYSAAEYFELSYMNDERRQIVVNTLKDYAMKALVNAMDHLGSMSYRVSGFINDQVDEVSGTELQVSCIEQRIRMCHDYIDMEGLSQQSLLIRAPKYHKRYILPGGCIPESAKPASPICEKSNTPMEDKESQEFQRVVHSTIRPRPPSSRKTRSPSPSPRARSLSPQKVRYPSPSPSHSKTYIAGKRPVSPPPISSPFTQSGSPSYRPNVWNSSMGKQYPSGPKKSASVHLHPERHDHKDTERNTSKGRGFLKALLSRQRTRDDEMLYTYLDEY